MPALNHDNMFQSWVFSPQELLQAQLLTTLQKQHIQNIIAQAAHEKTMLTFDPSNIPAYTQQEAELQGRIRVLQSLLDLSREAETILDPGARFQNLSGA